MRLAGYVWMCLLGAALAQAVAAQPLVYVVRHGEKFDESRDPPLSAAGEARAMKLGQMLGASGVNAIYTTQYQRTMQHGLPLSRALNIIPVVHAANDTAGLIRKINAHRANEVVLVVGHGNTVPEILRGLGHTGDVSIGEKEYDNLFVLVPRPPPPPLLLRLKY